MLNLFMVENGLTGKVRNWRSKVIYLFTSCLQIDIFLWTSDFPNSGKLSNDPSAF